MKGRDTSLYKLGSLPFFIITYLNNSIEGESSEIMKQSYDEETLRLSEPMVQCTVKLNLFWCALVSQTNDTANGQHERGQHKHWNQRDRATRH